MHPVIAYIASTAHLALRLALEVTAAQQRTATAMLILMALCLGLTALSLWLAQ
jgi:hypothetical protein